MSTAEARLTVRGIFTKLMDGFMPDWRARRDELNSAPLADERWVWATDGGRDQ